MTLGVPGALANVEAVVEGLFTTSIAHFACHGKQEPLKPLDSALILEPGRLPVLRIMQQRMSNGSLAFLCACETAMGDKNLPDEATSLGASLLFSGFRRIIATIWSIKDEDGPTIAEAFYEKLFDTKILKRMLFFYPVFHTLRCLNMLKRKQFEKTDSLI